MEIIVKVITAIVAVVVSTSALILRIPQDQQGSNQAYFDSLVREICQNEPVAINHCGDVYRIYEINQKPGGGHSLLTEDGTRVACPVVPSNVADDRCKDLPVCSHENLCDTIPLL